MSPTATATIKGIDLCGYLVNDPAAAIAFYRDRLGLEPTAVDPEGRGAEFTLSDGTTFGVWKEPGASVGGFVMFSVDDAKAAVTALRARGLEISDVDETPVCFMAFAKDPEENSVIIHQHK